MRQPPLPDPLRSAAARLSSMFMLFLLFAPFVVFTGKAMESLWPYVLIILGLLLALRISMRMRFERRHGWPRD